MDTSNVWTNTVSDYRVATWTVAFTSSKRAKWDWYELCIEKILKRYLSKSLSAVSHNIQVKSKNMSWIKLVELFTMISSFSMQTLSGLHYVIVLNQKTHELE